MRVHNAVRLGERLVMLDAVIALSSRALQCQHRVITNIFALCV